MKSNIKRTALGAVLAALLIISKEVLAFIPNVEIVTMLIMVYTVSLPLPVVLSVVAVFIGVQGILYGINTYFIGYIIVWPTLVFITLLMKKGKIKSEFAYASASGLFGFLFDIPFAVANAFMFGINYAITYLISGTVYSVVHGAVNFIVVLLLFKPLIKWFEKQKYVDLKTI